MVAALVGLGPAAVGLAVALSGLGRVSRSLGAASQMSEHAVLRIFVAALLFGHAVAMTTVFDPTPASSPPLLIAVVGLVVGWLVLLPTMLWPAASVWLGRSAMVFDAALVSAFLHFGGQEAAGTVTLLGRGCGRLCSPQGTLDAGNSGTTMRTTSS